MSLQPVVAGEDVYELFGPRSDHKDCFTKSIPMTTESSNELSTDERFDVAI